jgi:diguanylate cyclase (GGDEF)-like protein
MSGIARSGGLFILYSQERLTGRDNSMARSKPVHTSRAFPRLEEAMRRRSSAFIFLMTALGALAIFAIDLAAPAEIRLHGLYVFPLAIAARYCARLAWPIALLVLTSALQVAAYRLQVVASPSWISDVAMPIATSALILFLARAWRRSYLTAVRQAAIDPLTGIGNRRAFLADLRAEIVRQKRSAGSFSLALLDLDGFKALNDSKGHRAGDEALKLVADVLRSRTRQSDSVGRIGGDEFGILMPDTGPECGSMLGEVCAAIARSTAAADCAVTTSIGCATFLSPPEDPAAALQQADQIMYEAKLRHRNRRDRPRLNPAVLAEEGSAAEAQVLTGVGSSSLQ